MADMHAVSIGKPSEQMSNFWMVWFLKQNLNRISVFCASLTVTSGNVGQS